MGYIDPAVCAPLWMRESLLLAPCFASQMVDATQIAEAHALREFSGLLPKVDRTKTMVEGQAIVVMGVSGAGKSTVGELLAAKLQCMFYDADAFHSAQNKEKMRNGIPLTDEDRMPWLETLRDLLIEHVLRDDRVVLACSALRPNYRDLLRTADYEFIPEASKEGVSKFNKDLVTSSQVTGGGQERDLSSHVVFVYLKGTAELLAARLVARDVAGTHFMPATLLASQIDTLLLEEGETDVLRVDASLPPSAIVENIQKQLLM